MKKKIMLLFILGLLSIFLNACGGGDSGSNEPSVDKVVLSIVDNKIKILAGGNEKSIINVKLLNSLDEEVLGQTTDIFVNDQKYNGMEFYSTQEGEYKIYAKYGDIKSNEVIIIVSRIPERISKIELKSNKEVIYSDGIESITFSAIIMNQYDEIMNDKEVQYFAEGNLLTTNNFKSTEIGFYEVYAKSEGIKSNIIIIEVKYENSKLNTIEIISDKNSLISNGIDLVKFQINTLDQYGGKFSVEGLEIFINEEKLNVLDFKTLESGTYKVYAKYGEIKSNELVIEANNLSSELSEIKISADKTSIISDGIDTVKFDLETLDQYGGKFSVEGLEIFINEEKLNVLDFKTLESGMYKVYAKYGEIKSNELVIEANNLPSELSEIKISADKTSIISDGIDTVKFDLETLDQYGKAFLVEELEIFINEEKLNVLDFKTLESGTYKVYAKYGEIKSKVIEIVAKNSIFEGDFTITNEMTPEYLNSIEIITGSLLVKNDVIKVEMLNLQKVGKEIKFTESNVLEEVNLTNLKTIGNFIELDSLPELIKLNLSSLENITGSGKNIKVYTYTKMSLLISNCNNLDSLELPNLKALDAGIYLFSNLSLLKIEMNLLKTIGGETYISSNHLSELNLELLVSAKGNFYLNNENNIKSLLLNLESVSGELIIRENAFLENIELKELKKVDSVLLIYANSTLNTLNLESLTIVGNYLELKELPELVNLDLSNLENISGKGKNIKIYSYSRISLLIEGCNKLKTLELLKLKAINAGIYIFSNSNLEKVNINLLKRLGADIYISENNISELNLSSMISSNGNFYIVNENNIKNLLLNLESVLGELIIRENSSLEKIDLSKLEIAKSLIYIYDNSSLEELNLNKIKTIGSDLTLHTLPKLKKIDISNLESITGVGRKLNIDGTFYYASLMLYKCNDLLELDLRTLISLEKGIHIDDNLNLSSINIENLKIAGERVLFSNNNLSSLNLNSLTSIDGDFEITNEHSLLSIDLNLEMVNSNLFIRENNLLETINLSKIEKIDSIFYVGNNPSLKTLEVESLKNIGSYLKLYSLDNLDKLNLSNLETITGQGKNTNFSGTYSYISLTVLNCNKLEELELLSLKSLEKGFYLEGNSKLKKLDLKELKVIGGKTYISSNNIIELNLDSLAMINGSFDFLKENSIIDFNLNIESISGDLLIKENSLLKTIRLNKLKNISDIFYIGKNPSLNIIESETLKDIGSYFKLELLDGLSSLELPNLESITGQGRNTSFSGRYSYISLILLNCSNLESFKLPKLSFMDKGLHIEGNSNILEFSLQNLKSIGGKTYIAKNDFKKLAMDSLISISGDLVIKENNNLDSIIMKNLTKIIEDVYINFSTEGIFDVAEEFVCNGEIEIINGAIN